MNSAAENEVDDENGLSVKNILCDNQEHVRIIESAKEFLKGNEDMDSERETSIKTNTDFTKGLIKVFPLGTEKPHGQLKLGTGEEYNSKEDINLDVLIMVDTIDMACKDTGNLIISFSLVDDPKDVSEKYFLFTAYANQH